MPGSNFGTEFRVTTFGESHGGAVGVVVDGITPGLELDVSEVQFELDRRKPGQSEVTTPRKETDEVQILSGIFEGKATGTPLMMILYNRDAQPSAYEEIKHLYRPGHADFTYLAKYGLRDYRGSGRASGRETAGRVAAGQLRRNFWSAAEFGLRPTPIEPRASRVRRSTAARSSEIQCVPPIRKQPPSWCNA